MKEKEALELYKELKSLISSKMEDEKERNYLAKLLFCDVNFITEGDLTEYIKSLAKEKNIG